MTRSDLFIIVALPLIAIALAVVFGIVRPRQRRRARLRGPIAFTVLTNQDDVVPPRPPRPPTLEHARAQAQAPAPPVPPVASPVIHVATATGTDGLLPIESKVAEPPHLRLETSVADVAPPRTDSRTSPRKPQRPVVDGTLQFLAGRLEVVEGRDVGQEIRFVRQPGEEGTTVTFGRNDGPPYRHVQLHEPTVSRLHAKLTLEGKRWRLTNMSKTNPVVVNDAPLEGEGSSLVLSEGDRVEMGEVVFRFRAK